MASKPTDGNYKDFSENGCLVGCLGIGLIAALLLYLKIVGVL